ncbi:MAG: hypothetical protein Q8N69_02275, partial [bacterium]|nr:hypothetical protein [bacterium]
MAKKILAIVIMAANLMIFMAPSAAEAATCSAKNLRWASSNNRVYITGNGSCTLSDIKMFGSKYIPLEEVDSQNKIWHLGANIFVEDGSSLSIHGDSAGGDVNELRMKSDGSGNISIRSKGGAIDISGTKIISWDKSKNGPDADFSNGRAFISAQSSVKDGKKIEARMDIK